MKISFVIPFHNEEESAPLMLERVLKFGKKQGWQFEIIPVNDRSTDRTREILEAWAKKEARIRPVHLTGKGELGNTMGLALKAGTKKAKGGVIIWTMGDMADETKTYGEIVNKIKQGDEMVIGSRYMPGGSRGNLNVLKAWLSSHGTVLARILFKVPVHDITNAFRGFKKEVFDQIKLEAKSFDISPELALKAHLKGYRLGEVPTVYTNREKGVPKFKLLKMTLAYLKVYGKLLFKKDQI